jgi:3-dehydroquinate synthase
MSEGMVVRSRLRDYEVRFVSDAATGERNWGDVYFLVDEVIARLHPRATAGLPPERVITLSATEETKTLEGAQRLLTELIERGVRRNHRLVAIGGGVIQDVAAFAASILYRGIDWVFVPTTLLAQADSCIGGKTSINMGKYKNILGNFHPPEVILTDVSFLATLPESEIRSGIGEMMHFFLVCARPEAKELMVEHAEVLRDVTRLERYVKASLETKRSVIEIDEFDKGPRLNFNYGHTFGHAIESITNYGVTHGEAVTLGMDIANYISMRLGMLPEAEFLRLRELLSPNFPEFRLEESMLPKYVEALTRDKKNREGQLGAILTRGPGKMELTFLEFTGALQALLPEYVRAEAVRMSFTSLTS